MNWFKKKFDALAAKLNDDDALPALPEKKEAVVTNPADEYRPDNIEELKEISIGAITNMVRMLGYGKTVVSGLTFHTRFSDNAVENVGLLALVKDESFINRIHRDFKAKGIRYKEDMKIDVVHESAVWDKVTRVTEGIGVEVLTPAETLRKIKARLVATEGITWEPEYILESTGKQYFIGRCKDPKIENGPKIHNDIAFIGVEEKDEEQYRINNYMSRSHAMIVFDRDLGAYKIYRSKFLNNPAHKIKIYNALLNDFNGISLNQSTVPHVLKHGDSITFNDKIVLEFYLMNE